MESSTVSEKIKKHFEEKILNDEMLYDMQCITIRHENLHELVKFLYDDDELQFRFLTSMNAMHFPDAAEKFGLVIHLHAWTHNYRLRLKAFTNQDPPTFPTFTDIFPAANWMEREAYDFFGFKFTGHPDLRRILNVDDMQGWPLRKEYPLEDQARYDKDDKMFGR
jgi:NADH-quinone oxidoreductase subunit C